MTVTLGAAMYRLTFVMCFAVASQAALAQGILTDSATACDQYRAGESLENIAESGATVVTGDRIYAPGMGCNLSPALVPDRVSDRESFHMAGCFDRTGEGRQDLITARTEAKAPGVFWITGQDGWSYEFALCEPS